MVVVDGVSAAELAEDCLALVIWSASPLATDAATLNGDIGSSGISVTVSAAALTVHWNFTPVQALPEISFLRLLSHIEVDSYSM